NGRFRLRSSSRLMPYKPSPTTKKPMGILIEKIEVQPQILTNNPPAIGPKIKAIAVVADQIPTIRLRTLKSLKVIRIIDIAQGITPAPTITITQNTSREN